MTQIFMGPFFSWHSWGIYHLSGTLLSLGDIAINRVDKFRASMKLTFQRWNIQSFNAKINSVCYISHSDKCKGQKGQKETENNEEGAT